MRGAFAETVELLAVTASFWGLGSGLAAGAGVEETFDVVACAETLELLAVTVSFCGLGARLAAGADAEDTFAVAACAETLELLAGTVSFWGLVARFAAGTGAAEPFAVVLSCGDDATPDVGLKHRRAGDLRAGLLEACIEDGDVLLGVLVFVCGLRSCSCGTTFFTSSATGGSSNGIWCSQVPTDGLRAHTVVNVLGTPASVLNISSESLGSAGSSVLG